MLIACVAFTGCTSDEVSSFGDVYGIISDTKSGSPIRNAEITISPGNSTTVSGSDGHFEFKSLTPSQYKISVTADGYSSNSRQVTIVAGQSVSCDIHLTPQNNDVVMITPTSLDFGVNELQLATTITNESDSETEWFLDLGDTPWLYAYPTTGRIGGGKTHSIVFTANRARMKEDKSSIVKVSAFGDDTPLSIKCKQSVQLSSVMVVESLNVDFGEEATEQIIRIHNISETDVNWTLWGNDSGYLTMSATHGIVAPGGSQIVTISLNREELDEVLATTFKISDGTVDQPINVIAYPTPEGATTTNKIFYTSTDGNIVEPYNPAAFLDANGATLNIVSNTYEYGQGVITFDGEVAVTDIEAFKQCQTLASITIPHTLTHIGGGMFDGCNNLVSIIIPDNVTIIDSSAFARCSNLVTINLPSDLTIISGGLFSDCNNLTSVNIPNKVSLIGESAFQNCSSLTTINLPNSVTDIYGWAFAGCSNLTDINIPNGVKKIWQYAFQECSSLTTLHLPDSISEIMFDAFHGCSHLVSINIPNGITYIGGWTFAKCYSLTSINIPDSVTSIKQNAFQECSSLTSISIPGSVTSIEEMAFSSCSGLTSITIPDGVTSIGNYAFAGCCSLTRVDCLPITPPTIGSNVFDDTSADCKIYVPDGTYDTYVTADGWAQYKDMIVNPNPTTAVQSQIFYTSTDGAIVTPYNTSAFLDADGNALNIVSNTYENGQGVITIDGELVALGNQALRECTTLATITIPDAVTSIERIAFYGCSGLTSITIPNGVTSIDESAFSGCSGLTSINIPDAVTSIGDYAFDSCSGLISINIPDAVTSIGGGAFRGCSGLTSINIPDGVTSIGSYTFYNCSGLTSITIPDGVTSIGQQAFYDCSKLTSINIPDTVTSIGSQAFANCSNLTSINIPDAVISIGSYTFVNCIQKPKTTKTNQKQPFVNL